MQKTHSITTQSTKKNCITKLFTKDDYYRAVKIYFDKVKMTNTLKIQQLISIEVIDPFND
jgi:hypothetical protein